MGNNPKHGLTPTLLFIVIIAISMTPNNADDELHISFPSLPSTTHPPSHAPAPSPSHRHHHHPGVTHHHHNHSPALAPSPSYASAPHQPSKPVTPSPPVAHAPTAKPPVAKSPVKAPTAKPPAYPPVKAPSPVTTPVGKRKFVAVQGMVYCKNCSYSGVNTLLGASPLAGARVVLRCKNTQYLLRKTATTDNNGYFFLEAPPMLTTYGAHKCKVYLAHLAKPIGPCSNATDLNNGATGAYLFSNNTGPPKEDIPAFSLFSVGPFAYQSRDCPTN